MRLIATLLIIFLLAGCSTFKTSSSQSVLSISPQDKKALFEQTGGLPLTLKSAFNPEIESLSSSSSGSHSQKSNKDVLLKALLRSTQHGMLRPDEAFEKLVAVAYGKAVNKSLDEVFVESLVAFIQTPDLYCRQPLLSQYFRERYTDDSPLPSCTGVLPFKVVTYAEGEQIQWLDLNRVRSIHFAFAGEGEGIASRFGHTALRLVVCPTVNSSDDECDANLTEHLILGFGAHVNDLDLDLTKALMGGYQAYLHASPFMDNYRNYAIAEFRELYSLPFILSEQQKDDMLRGLAQIHWSFSDEYHFFSMNCTGLLQRAMQVLLPGFADSKDMADLFMRPDSFFEAIQETRWLASKSIIDLEKAEQEGFYFSSTKPFYDKAAKVLAEEMKQPWFKNVPGYLSKPPIYRKEHIASDSSYLGKIRGNQYLRDANLMLEELAMLRSERRLMKAMAEYYGETNSEELASVRETLSFEQQIVWDECLFKPLALLSQSIERVPHIPGRQDVLPSSDSMLDCQGEFSQAHLRTVIERLVELDSSAWRDILLGMDAWIQSMNNVMFLKQSPINK